ncbi:MAG: NUDIX hydrolase [Pseudomonadales bacterium]
MKYCSTCGEQVALQIPEGDDRERHVCTVCGFIHYSNPRIIVGSVPVFQHKVLLCKRAIEPRLGYWTLPAGFLENGESTLAGATRETLEEACAVISNGRIYTVFDLPQINQVYIFYLAELDNGEFGVGPESLECGLYQESDIPWKELAFPVIGKTLKHYFSDRSKGSFPVRTEVLTYPRHVFREE